MIAFYDRTAYWLFILEIPYIRGKELLSAVKIKLNSLYPGNIADCKIHIRKNGSKKWSYLVFVLNQDTGKTMLPLSPLFIQHLYAQKTTNALFVDKQWLDYVRIENGEIRSSTVKIRDETMSLDDIKNLCDLETDLTVYCDETDKQFFAPLQENNNIKFFDKHTEIKKVDVHKISLFAEKSPVMKKLRILASIAVLSLITLGSWMFYQHHQDENERNAQLRLEQEQLQRAAMERQRENQRLLELRNIYQEIISARTASPFDISVVIAECAEPQTRIQSATFNGNFFQIEGVTNTSLVLLRNFENHRLVSNVRLHQVHPSGGLDTFTLSGTIQPEFVTVDETLPISEQIKILENLIEYETNNALLNSHSSPSAFGEAVNSLFTRWGGTVSTYQFMNDPHYTEVELSLRGTGNGFFNALHEIHTRYRSWDIRLTQIRNLFPRNMLEVVIRVRTEISNENNTNDTPSTTPNPFPIASISRNYFIPAAPIFRPVEQPVIVAPPPIATPVRVERVNWLVYIGSIREDDYVRYIYLRNTRTGSLITLRDNNEGNMRFAFNQAGNIIAYIDDNIFEINRR
ncbi:MAG: hypothetical protein FWC97_01110 [Treponema sp.]|nr:hypothetical protein [Treponema sp.]